MADLLTGLGITIDESRSIHGHVSLSSLASQAKERERNSEFVECQIGQVKVNDAGLVVAGEPKCPMDDMAYEVLGKLFDIPLQYLLKLGRSMKNANIMYWIERMSDKDAVFVFRDGGLVDVKVDARIEVADVLGVLDDGIPGGVVMGSSQQPNATMLDIYMPHASYEHSGRDFLGGVRAVVKRGLKAPEIAPIFVDADSCGIIECAENVERVSIKNLGYGDIMRVVEEQVVGSVASLDGLFESYCSIANKMVDNPRRRIALYCREHAVPDRVCSYAMGAYAGSGARSACYGDIISLFSVMGFVDEVKQQSERKMQRLAGHIVTKARSEHRCGKCDSIVLEV